MTGLGRSLFLCVVMLAAAAPLVLESARVARADDGAAAILERLRALDSGPRRWTDRRQTATLRIFDAAGKERVREIESFGKRYPDGKEKILVFLLSPAELRGTGFLQHSHPGRADEQWLYLPQTKRIRQITARVKDESFAGTDFSYRDLELLSEIARWTDEEASARIDGEETIGGFPAHVIAYRPRDPATAGYPGLRTWLRKHDLSTLKVEFHLEDGAPKVLDIGDIRSVGGIPTPHRLVMRNPRSGGRTVVEVTAASYDQGLADDLFTQRSLEGGPQ